jgi:hypothetical protein
MGAKTPYGDQRGCNLQANFRQCTKNSAKRQRSRENNGINQGNDIPPALKILLYKQKNGTP